MFENFKSKLSAINSTFNFSDFSCVVNALVFYALLFSGRLTLGRVLPVLASVGLAAVEFRALAVIYFFVLGLLFWRKIKYLVFNSYETATFSTIVLFVIVQLFLISHALFYVTNENSLFFVWELFTVIVTGIVISVIYHNYGQKFVCALMAIALMFSLIYWIVVIFSSQEQIKLLATSFTLYRIQLFGGFSALYLCFNFKNANRNFKLTIMIAATICFALAFMTLSKAALIAGLAGLFFLIIVNMTWFLSEKRSLAILFIALISLTSFYCFSSSVFVARFSEGILGTGYSVVSQDTVNRLTIPQSPEQRKTSVNRQAKLQNKDQGTVSETDLKLQVIDGQLRLVKAIVCQAESGSCEFNVSNVEREIAGDMLRFHVYIPDYSFRIRLLLHGFSGFMKAPLMGNGFGAFNKVATNLYTKEPESYFYPHNVIVELLYTVGLVGTLLVLCVVMTFVWMYFRTKECIEASLPIFAFFIAICIGSFFGGDYMDFRLGWVCIILCVMLVNGRKLSVECINKP